MKKITESEFTKFVHKNPKVRALMVDVSKDMNSATEQFNQWAQGVPRNYKALYLYRGALGASISVATGLIAGWSNGMLPVFVLLGLVTTDIVLSHVEKKIVHSAMRADSFKMLKDVADYYDSIEKNPDERSAVVRAVKEDGLSKFHTIVLK